MDYDFVFIFIVCGISCYRFDPDFWSCDQFYVADYSVPVCLGVVGDAVGVVADLEFYSVVDFDG